MNISINNRPVELPSTVESISDLAVWKGLSNTAAAIARNDEIIRREQWDMVRIAEGDRILIIAAAFGG